MSVLSVPEDSILRECFMKQITQNAVAAGLSAIMNAVNADGCVMQMGACLTGTQNMHREKGNIPPGITKVAVTQNVVAAGSLIGITAVYVEKRVLEMVLHLAMDWIREVSITWKVQAFIPRAVNYMNRFIRNAAGALK